jgi:hypothetical protein
VNAATTKLEEDAIEIPALHSQMLDEQLCVFFMHFWVNDDTQRQLHRSDYALEAGEAFSAASAGEER